MKEKVEMYFKQLKLQNYSLFKDFQITPAKTGVNIILGPNNSGKTQIAGSFLIPLFSRNAVSKYPHALENESNIFLSIYGTNNQQDIKCTLRTKGESFEYIREIIETNPTGSDLRKKLVLPLKEGRSPSIIFTNRIPNEEFNEKDIEFINESFRSSPFTTIYEKEYQFIITNYCSRKISSNIISEGERHFLSWLREFSYRKTSTDNYPLIIDDEFSMMDHYHRRLICLLISSIAEKSQ